MDRKINQEKERVQIDKQKRGKKINIGKERER